MREYLEKSNVEGPYPNDVAAHFAEYNSIAEQAFKEGNYDTAQWWWSLLEEYWLYVSRLIRPDHLELRRICTEIDQLRKILRRSYHKCHEGLMRIVKECIRQLRYRDAAVFADDALSRRDVSNWEFDHFRHRLTPIVYTKLQLCACMARTALGDIEDGMACLKAAADTILYPWGLTIVYTNLSRTDLVEDLEQVVDNELVRAKSLWRCGCQSPLSPTEQSGPDWQVGAVKRSFWEWIELPEERGVAPTEEAEEA
jgi:hypothetical protein